FEGDFVTSPDLGPAFGRSLARGVADLWLLMGKPATWDLVEAGAGRGILMRDLLGALERERADAARGARPAIVEVSPRMRAQQSLALEGRDLRWASGVRTAGGGDEAARRTHQGAGTVRGVAQHRLIADPLAEPGRHDLTASVDFTAIRRAAEGAGLQLVGTSTQREVLVALGIREATA